MKRAVAILALLALSACSQADQADPYVATVQQIGGALLNRGGATEPVSFTATRASLRAAGIDRTVLVTRMARHELSVGLLEFQNTRRGVTVWRSTDGSTISTAAGLLRNTRGFGPDLHSLETAPLERALAAGENAEYSRLYRALNGLNVEATARLYCALVVEGPERVDILGRGYQTTRFRETCRSADGSDPVFENIYWRGSDGEIWKSHQWAGPDLGYADLERLVL